MKSLWKSFEPLDPNRQYHVFASSIPTREYSSTWKMCSAARPNLRRR